jgi:hypothetical protein
MAADPAGNLIHLIGIGRAKCKPGTAQREIQTFKPAGRKPFTTLQKS